MNHNFNEENKLEDFAFISNGNYFDIKTNLKSKPIFLSKKKKFFFTKNPSENEKKNENINSFSPFIKKNFFDELNLNQKNEIKIKTFLIK